MLVRFWIHMGKTYVGLLLFCSDSIWVSLSVAVKSYVAFSVTVTTDRCLSGCVVQSNVMWVCYSIVGRRSGITNLCSCWGMYSMSFILSWSSCFEC